MGGKLVRYGTVYPRRQGAGWYYEEGEEGVCQCRHEMQWNKAAFECQVEYVSCMQELQCQVE